MEEPNSIDSECASAITRFDPVIKAAPMVASTALLFSLKPSKEVATSKKSNENANEENSLSYNDSSDVEWYAVFIVAVRKIAQPKKHWRTEK